MQSSHNPIRILLADDHPLWRDGVSGLVADQPDMKLVAEASNGREAVDQFRKYHPDITLLDLQMPEISGIDAILTIRSDYPDARIIVIWRRRMSSFPKPHKRKLKRHLVRNQMRRCTATRGRVMPSPAITENTTTPPRLTLPTVGRANSSIASYDHIFLSSSPSWNAIADFIQPSLLRRFS